VPADVPTTGPNLRHPGEKPPVEPVAALAHTAAGAKAFAEFFIRTIDWGYATTSSTYMRHYFQHSCVGCRSIAKALDDAKKNAHRFIGDRFTITKTSLRTDRGAKGDLTLVVQFDVSSGEVVDARGRAVAAEPAMPGYREQVDLQWVNPSWAVAELAVVK
jgi:hypothetical protein